MASPRFRMEAIAVEPLPSDDNFIEALCEGLNDAYEMVVARQSAIYAGFRR